MFTAFAKKKRHYGATTSVFKNARNLRINDSSININSTTNLVDADPLNLLREKVATNAILNAGGRADEVRCHPGTREELIGLVDRWMDSRNENGATPNMMWLSGPAGAGKSAIVQTVAERCKERGVQAANFFFFRGDPTRSTAGPLVATLLYQILKFHPDACDSVVDIISRDPLIFGTSIQDQFSQLLSSPLQKIPPPPKPPARRPIVLLIDGLDECDSESKQPQGHVLLALDDLLTQKDSPFLALVASRAEPQISGTFKRLSCPVQSIFLDDKYQPEKDIRLFVNAKFDEIKQYHHLAHTLKKNWPSASDVDAIVEKSSGQFAFSATVMRFIANSSARPDLSLERVKVIAPAAQNSPFAALDAIYLYILSQAEDQEAVRDLLSAELLARAFVGLHSFEGRHVPQMHTQTILNFAYPLRYPDDSMQSYVSDLSAILQLQKCRLVFYHASLTDFLEDQSRSGEYHVDLDAFLTKITPVVWKNGSTDSLGRCLSLYLLHLQKKRHPDITRMLKTLKLEQYQEYYHITRKRDFLGVIKRLYYPGDLITYNSMICQWTSIVVSLPHDYYYDISYLPFEGMYVLFYSMKWWLRGCMTCMPPPNKYSVQTHHV